MARVFGSLYKILTKPKLMSPHLRLERFSDLNLPELKRLGIEYLAIDKDSTLTQHQESHVYDLQIHQTLLEAQKVFGKKKCAVLSNDLRFGTGREIEGLNWQGQRVGFSCIALDYKTKKPWSENAILEYWGLANFEENKSKIAFIGDRLLTDVFQANKCGGMAILTKPIPGPKDNAHSQRLRFVEEEFYNWFCPKDIGFETHDSHWVSAEELKKLLIKPRKGRDR